MTILAIAAVILALASVPGTIELLLLTLSGLSYRQPTRAKTHASRLAIVVPAHNEALHIARCVDSISASIGSLDAEVVVIADNCDDDTATRAEAAGARVIERTDTERRGKGYALDHAFGTLSNDGFDAFVVVDADSIVSANFVSALAANFDAGADAVQCRYTALNANANLRTRLMNVALMAFNVLRPRGRHALGLSAGILGNGFGLSADTLASVPYTAASVVEDLEYHIMLVRHGRRVWFVDEARVLGDMPTGGQGSRTQRARWEGGRFLMLRRHVPGLLREALAGRWRLFEPALDLALLPLAWHVLLILPLLAIPVHATQLYALAAVAVVLLHVLAAIRVGGGGIRDVAALALAPFYIVWKLTVVKMMRQNARNEASWVRTEREGGDVRRESTDD